MGYVFRHQAIKMVLLYKLFICVLFINFTNSKLKSTSTTIKLKFELDPGESNSNTSGFLCGSSGLAARQNWTTCWEDAPLLIPQSFLYSASRNYSRKSSTSWVQGVDFGDDQILLMNEILDGFLNDFVRPISRNSLDYIAQIDAAWDCAVADMILIVFRWWIMSYPNGISWDSIDIFHTKKHIRKISIKLNIFTPGSYEMQC
jgi:hypothetical protein